MHSDPWHLPQDLVTTPTSSRCCNKPCYLHSDPWQLPQDLITAPKFLQVLQPALLPTLRPLAASTRHGHHTNSSTCFNQPCYLHSNPWQLPKDVVTTPSFSRCCNQPRYLHSDPWQLQKDLVTTPTSSRCCNQPCYLHSDCWKLTQDPLPPQLP